MESLSEMLRKRNVTVTVSRFETNEGVQSLEDPFVSSCNIQFHEHVYLCPIGHSVWF